MSHLIFHLYRAYEKEIDSGDSELDSDSLRMQKMLDYIENHFHENLDLSQICLLYTSSSRVRTVLPATGSWVSDMPG